MREQGEVAGPGRRGGDQRAAWGFEYLVGWHFGTESRDRTSVVTMTFIMFGLGIAKILTRFHS